MRQMLGSLVNSRNSSKVTQDKSNSANFLSVPIQKSRAATIKNQIKIFMI